MPIFLLHAGVGLAYTFTEGFGWLSVYCLFVFAVTSNCWKEAARFREWQREWDALDPDYRPPRPLRDGIRFVRSVVVAVPIIVGCFWLFLHYGDPTSAAHVIAPMLVVGLLLLWIVSLVVRRKRRRTDPQEWIVSQATSRPLPAPSAAEAYARLPEYCRPLLNPEPARKEEL